MGEAEGVAAGAEAVLAGALPAVAGLTGALAAAELPGNPGLEFAGETLDGAVFVAVPVLD